MTNRFFKVIHSGSKPTTEEIANKFEKLEKLGIGFFKQDIAANLVGVSLSQFKAAYYLYCNNKDQKKVRWPYQNLTRKEKVINKGFIESIVNYAQGLECMEDEKHLSDNTIAMLKKTFSWYLVENPNDNLRT